MAGRPKKNKGSYWWTGTPGRRPGKSWCKDPRRYATKEWRQTTAMHRAAFPFCSECLKDGIVNPATLTDHITPIEDGGAFYDWDNLQSLCDKCHRVKSANEVNKRAGKVRGFVRGGRGKKK